MSKRPIKIAILGIGNCASALIQGIYYYAKKQDAATSGMMYYNLGGYCPSDIEIVAAFDIDRRKVGKDVSAAIFAKPNCTTIFFDAIPTIGVTVNMGCVLDGVADCMQSQLDDRTFLIDPAYSADRETIVAELIRSKADIVINYLPVGSQLATEFYAQCAIDAKCGFINCIPVFIGSNPQWIELFAAKNLPVIGDDIKSQIGATIIHRTLTTLFKRRGIKINHTYQLNVGGNTDFLNMTDQQRLASKKRSKTEAVQSVMASRLEEQDIHIGPSDYIPWLNDNKVAFIRMEGEIFGNVPMNLEMRLSVEDSPNSAGVAIDMIRCCKLALDHHLSGALLQPSAYYCKHPLRQIDDDSAWAQLDAFIKEYGISNLN